MFTMFQTQRCRKRVSTLWSRRNPNPKPIHLKEVIMSYPFCGCCPYSDEGRPSWDCGRCKHLQDMYEGDRKYIEGQKEKQNGDRV